MFWKWDSFRLLTTEMRNMVAVLGSLFRFELFIKGLVGLLLVPSITYMFTSFLTAMGWRAVSNNQWLQLITDPLSMVVIFALLLIAMLSLLLEIGGLICISHLAQKGEAIDLQTVVLHTLRKLPNMIGPGGLIMGFYFFLLAPLLELGGTTTLLSSITVPGFVEQHIYNSDTLTLLYIGVLVVLGVIGFFMSFALQVMFFEDAKPVAAIRKSVWLIKRHFWKLIRFWAGFNTLMLVVIAVLTFVWLFLTAYLLEYAAQWTMGGQVLLSIWFVLVMLGALVLTVGTAPFSVFIHTALYKKIIHQWHGHPEPDIHLVARGFQFLRFEKLLGNRRFWRFSGAILFTGFALLVFLYVAFVPLEVNKVEITAHRGSSMVAPENTLIAVEKGIEEGATWAEIDIQETKDGQLVLLHDKTLERTTGDSRGIWEVTTKDLEQLEAGAWFDPIFAGEPVPLLRDVIEKTKGRVKLNIEVKRNGNEKYLVPALVDLINELDYKNDCIVTSLEYELLQEVEKLDPSIRTGYVIYVAAGDVGSLNVDLISIESSRVSAAFVQRMHNVDKEVHTWTVNETEELEALRQMGVDNVITDQPADMVEYLDNWDKKSRMEKLMDVLLSGEW